jgi:tetratricopeptide (TPR) repeat protein
MSKEATTTPDRSRSARTLCWRALKQLHTGQGNAAATVGQALAADPGCMRAYCLRAALLVMTGRQDGNAALARVLRDAALHLDRALPLERRHLTAAQAWLDGDLKRALHLYAEIAEDDPHDTLALRVAHLGDLHWGRSAQLRDRVAAVLPHWRTHDLGYAHVLGMYAFGLAENGEHARAEAAAREALRLEPQHALALHSLAHVFEMQDRSAEGVAELRRNLHWWSQSRDCATHLWWHLALFHLDRGHIGTALQVLQQHLLTSDDASVSAWVDVSALMWRLHLLGVDLGPAWARVADAWERQRLGALRPFNDAHAMLAFVAAARWSSARRLIEAMRDSAARTHDLERPVQELALPVCEALLAFGQGRCDEASHQLQSVRSLAQRCGGSQAQCDLLHLTWLESAVRAGQSTLAHRLLDERLAQRPRSVLNELLGVRIASRADRSAATPRPTPLAPLAPVVAQCHA